MQETLRARIRLLGLLRWVERRRRYLLITFNCLSDAVPAGIALAAGWLVTTTESALADSGEPMQLARPLVALVAMFVLVELADSARGSLGRAAANDVERHVRQRIRQVSALSGAIDDLEDERFQDDLFSASSDDGERRKSAGTAAVGQLLLTSRFLGAILASLVVARFSPALALFLLSASLLGRATIRRQWIGLADIFLAHVPTLRRAEYFSELVVGAQAARDVRTYGLGKWLTERRQTVARSALVPLWQRRRAVLRKQGLAIFLSLGGSFAALLVPRLLASTGDMTVGELVTCLMAGFATLVIGSMGLEAFDIENGIVAAESYWRIEERRWDASARRIPDSPLTVPQIVFRDVTFSYRDREPVLSSLDLEIHPGEVLAIVGANGAGKTTLAKLLAGLYRPTSGAIEIDGQDLRYFSLAHWRTRLFEPPRVS